jgi:hypothetical protein
MTPRSEEDDAMPEDETIPEDAIRHRAHALWEEAGRPDGRDEEFWHRAREELALAARAPQEFAGETGAAPLPEPAAAPAPAKEKPKAARAPAKAKPRAKKG